ncbi:hypothetical protein L195_g061439, partial [Trifolium pratense]
STPSSPIKPTSDPQPDEPKQTSPTKSPEQNSEPMDSEPTQTSSAEHESPVRVHTCAPSPPPLTTDELIMRTSVFDEAFAHLGPPEVDVVSYISRKDLSSVKFIKTPPEQPKPYNVPYTYSKPSDPSDD